MSKSKKKKPRKPACELADDALDQLKPGMPAKDSIRRVVNFVSPQNTPYKILKTTETDAYDSVVIRGTKRGPKSS
jgi:hypothetical protein